MKRNKFCLIAMLFTLTSILGPIGQSPVKAQGGITRSAAEQRALNMINLTWTYSKDRNGNLDSSEAGIVSQPSQLNGVNTAVMTGIPYDWGGSDTVDTSTYGTPWGNFSDAVSKGAYTGNTTSSGGIGYVKGTAGVDCSGFIQAAFNIGGTKLSTSTLFNYYFKPIALNDIKHMDILNYPGHHVVIFDRWGTKNGVQGAYTYEATTNQVYGGIQGTKRYFMSLTAINNAYIPGRYINIIDDASVSKTGTMPSSSSAAAKPVQPKVLSTSQSAQTIPNNLDNPGDSAASSSNEAKQKNREVTVLSIESDPSGWCSVNYSHQIINISAKFPNLIS